MKNAQIPGAYRPYGHDYRPDLARSSARCSTFHAATNSLPVWRRRSKHEKSYGGGCSRRVRTVKL
jgi:hypothetical protein